MKAIFLTLLLANLGFVAWRIWIVRSEAPPVFVEAEGLPRLVLVGEDPDAIAAIQRDSYKPAAASSNLPSATQPDTDSQTVSTPGSASGAAGDTDGATTNTGNAVRNTGINPTGSGNGNGSNTDGSGRVATDTARSVSTPSVVDTTASPAAATGSPDKEDSDNGDVAVVLATADKRCVSLGPFQNLRDATEATASLNAQGLTPSQRLAESQVWFGHWVYLPPAASRAEAIAVVELLRSKGVTDIYIEPSGPMRHSISLGVFSDAAHAETRAGQIRRLSVGVRPQIRDRYRDSSVYWVDFDMPAGEVVDPAEFKGSSSQKLRLEGRDCAKNTGA